MNTSAPTEGPTSCAAGIMSDQVTWSYHLIIDSNGLTILLYCPEGAKVPICQSVLLKNQVEANI